MTGAFAPLDADLVGAALLLIVALVTARGAGAYGRFARILAAALALAVLTARLFPALSELQSAAALLVLPLSGVGLGLGTIARMARPVPAFAATTVMVLAFASAMIALFAQDAVAASVPLALSGLAVGLSSLHRLPSWQGLRVLACGALMIAAACAFLAAGAASGFLLLLSAVLAGLAQLQRAAQTLPSTQRGAMPVFRA